MTTLFTLAPRAMTFCHTGLACTLQHNAVLTYNAPEARKINTERSCGVIDRSVCVSLFIFVSFGNLLLTFAKGSKYC